MARTAPVASLPMYDWPEVRWAHDALWEILAGRLDAAGIAAPQALERGRAIDAVWRDPGLVISQTCGLPYSTRLRGIVRLVATPVYSAPGCEGPSYSSMIVARNDDAGNSLRDMRGRSFAYNGTDSLSGNVALRAAMKEAGLDLSAERWMETGSHRNSIRAVAAGTADVAAIDAVCWALALRYERESVAGLKVIATTPMRPGLPLITAVERSDREVDILRTELSETLAENSARDALEAIGIAGMKLLSEWDYTPIAALARQAG